MLKHLTLAATLAATALPVWAEVYKCRNSEGRLQFQAQPCDNHPSEQVKIAPPTSNPGNYKALQRRAEQSFEQRRQERAIEESRMDAKSQRILDKRRHQRRLDELAGLGKVVVGMDEDQATRAWGHPCEVKRSGSGQKWTYCVGEYERDYLYFRDGLV
ncbi:DUF4124 domain-containing protein [Marinobacterium litorale]|uniref:DUF4124 domain-containing protein n=1 Tax=Marinobacterium litorale TaxID=404770 RepID=UPI00040A478B|nr:DUF4124 domain-containing protein [Marinobacterium litorale]